MPKSHPLIPIGSLVSTEKMQILKSLVFPKTPADENPGSTAKQGEPSMSPSERYEALLKQRRIAEE